MYRAFRFEEINLPLNGYSHPVLMRKYAIFNGRYTVYGKSNGHLINSY